MVAISQWISTALNPELSTALRLPQLLWDCLGHWDCLGYSEIALATILRWLLLARRGMVWGRLQGHIWKRGFVEIESCINLVQFGRITIDKIICNSLTIIMFIIMIIILIIISIIISIMERTRVTKCDPQHTTTPQTPEKGYKVIS